jgi:hypothetical protein
MQEVLALMAPSFHYLGFLPDHFFVRARISTIIINFAHMYFVGSNVPANVNVQDVDVVACVLADGPCTSN